MVYGFLLVFFSNFVPKMHRFRHIRLLSIHWPWNPGWGSLKVIENYTIQSGTYDFLLTFHSNHRPISHRFRDKRRYRRKSPENRQFYHPTCI